MAVGEFQCHRRTETHMGTFRPDAKARHNVACARGKTTRNMKRHDTDEQSKARHSHHSGQDENAQDSDQNSDQDADCGDHKSNRDNDRDANQKQRQKQRPKRQASDDDIAGDLIMRLYDCLPFLLVFDIWQRPADRACAQASLA